VLDGASVHAVPGLARAFSTSSYTFVDKACTALGTRARDVGGASVTPASSYR